MMKSVEGVYRDGRVELLEQPPDDRPARVIVTFLVGGVVDLKSRGINPEQAADLRARLRPFIEDWSRADMDVYDA